MQLPPASLLVPCHNGASYLPRLWASVRAQTYSFSETICYDDGSTDDSAAVAAALGFTVLRGVERRGPAHARNELAKAAGCPWIHFHDADDVMHPDYLARSLAVAASGTADVIVCDADWVTETTGHLEIARRYSQRALATDAVIASLVNPIGGITNLYRADTFRGVGGFDERFSCWEDADLHVRLAAAGARFAALGEVLVSSYRHARGASGDQGGCMRARLLLLREYAASLPISARPTIAAEAERLARGFVGVSDSRGAMDALVLCRQLGGDPPTTANPLLRALKGIAPELRVLQAQHFIRWVHRTTERR